MKSTTIVEIVIILATLLALSFSIAFAVSESANVTETMNCSDLRNCVESCGQIQNCSTYLICIENCTINATSVGGKMGVEAVLKKYEERLMQIPNVTGVGIGEKSGKEVIIVFVRKKIPEAALQPNETIPQELDGYLTDVQEEIRVY